MKNENIDGDGWWWWLWWWLWWVVVVMVVVVVVLVVVMVYPLHPDNVCHRIPFTAALI